MSSIGRTTLNMKSFFNVFAIAAVLLLHKAEADHDGWYVALSGLSCGSFCNEILDLPCDDTRPPQITTLISATFVAGQIENAGAFTAAPMPDPMGPGASVPFVAGGSVLTYAATVGTDYSCESVPTTGSGQFALCCCSDQVPEADNDPVQLALDCPLMAPATPAPISVSPTTAAPTTAAPTSAPSTAAPTGGKKAGVPSGGGKRGGFVPSPLPGPSSGGGKKGSPTGPGSVSTKSGKRRALFSN